MLKTTFEAGPVLDWPDEYNLLVSDAKTLRKFYEANKDFYEAHLDLDDIDDSQIETASDTICEMLNGKSKSTDKITLYRGIVLFDDEKVDLEKPGYCWSWNEGTAEHLATELNDPCLDARTVVLEAECELRNLDLLYMILLNALEPDEKEARVIDDCLLENVHILKDFKPE